VYNLLFFSFSHTLKNILSAGCRLAFAHTPALPLRLCGLLVVFRMQERSVLQLPVPEGVLEGAQESVQAESVATVRGQIRKLITLSSSVSHSKGLTFRLSTLVMA